MQLVEILVVPKISLLRANIIFTITQSKITHGKVPNSNPTRNVPSDKITYCVLDYVLPNGLLCIKASKTKIA